MILGEIRIKDFLEKTGGEVIGTVNTDAKIRTYKSYYRWSVNSEDSNYINISKADGTGDVVKLKPIIELDESLIAFFGLYSGDGSKGSEDPSKLGVIIPSISFSQREPNLVKFAYSCFKKFFGESIRFTFSLGEDSAYFMDGEGLRILQNYYHNDLPILPPLSEVRNALNDADKRYLKEVRRSQESNEAGLAFYYFFKNAMEDILREVKKKDLQRVGIILGDKDKVTASLRRPFKKGARLPGGSSRSDELHIGGLNGFGSLFLKIMHEIEESILNNRQSSVQGLILWKDIPSKIGHKLNTIEFFNNNSFARVFNQRPKMESNMYDHSTVLGTWRLSKTLKLYSEITICPLLCYTSGLYLAEGSTSKDIVFSLYKSATLPLTFGFTSSEGNSIELIVKSLNCIFKQEQLIATWKVKVGSQYFNELVVVGLKNAVPMLRGGSSGDGKMRTMEISLEIKNWALELAPIMKEYSDRFSHVEPTGAGVPRIDITATSSFCKWYFPIMLYSVFYDLTNDPKSFFL